MCDKAVSYVQRGSGHGKGFKLYEQDYTRLHIVFASQLQVIMCFPVSADSRFVLVRENNGCRSATNYFLSSNNLFV